MKLPINHSLQQSLLYGLSVALMKGVSLLILPFIAHQLTTAEFGRLEVISTLAIIGSILVGMGLEDTLFRFAGSAKTKQQQSDIASELFTLSLLVTMSALVIGWMSAATIAHWIPGSPSTYEIRLVLAVLALESCIAVPLGWLRMNNRAMHFFLASCGRALIQAILVVIFLYFDRGVAGILEAGLIAAVLQTLILSYWQLQGTGLRLNLKTGKRSLTYSLPIMASGLLAFALNGLDRWILAEQTTLSEVAEFAIAAKFALATVLLLQPFGMWWSPRRFAVLNETDGDKKVAYFITLGTVIALLIAVWVSLLSPLLINQLLPQSYLNAGSYVLGLVAIMLLKELVELFNIGCFNGTTTKAQFIINLIAALLGITAMLLLTPLYHAWGVIGSLLIAQSVRLLLFYQVGQYYLPLNYPIPALFILAILSIIWVIIGSQLIILWQIIIVLLAATTTLLACATQLKLIRLAFLPLHKVAHS